MKTDLRLPETGYVRMPVVLHHVPMGKSTIWAKIKTGEFPRPVKLSARVTAWRAEEIREYINQFSAKKEA